MKVHFNEDLVGTILTIQQLEFHACNIYNSI